MCLWLQKDLEIPVPRYFQTEIQLLRDKQTMFTRILETQRTNQEVRVLLRPSLCS